MKGKYLTLVGTALTLALSSSVAVAQSSKFPELQKQNQEETTASQDRELPPDVMEILCKNFPLNSRCQGGGGATPVAPDTMDTPVDTEDSGGSPNPDLAPAPEFNEDTTAPDPDNSTNELLVPVPSNEPINPAPDSTETPTNPMETTPGMETIPGSENELPSSSPENPDDGSSNQEAAPLNVPGGSNEESNPSLPSPTNINPSNPGEIDSNSETEQNQEVSEPEGLQLPSGEVKPEESPNPREIEQKPAIPGATTSPQNSQEEMGNPEKEPVPGAQQLQLPNNTNSEVEQQPSTPSGL